MRMTKKRKKRKKMKSRRHKVTRRAISNLQLIWDISLHSTCQLLYHPCQNKPIYAIQAVPLEQWKKNQESKESHDDATS